MERTQFTFYRSFASAIRRIRKDADRARAYDVICDYALDGTEPDFSELPDSVAIAFDLIKPVLDTGKRKAESGKNGATAKQSASKALANGKQSVSKPQANNKQSVSKAVANSKQSNSNTVARENAKRGETVSEGEKEKEGEKEGEKEKEGEIEKEKENECYLSPLPPSLKESVKQWMSYKQERREGYKPQGLKSLVTEIGNNATRYGEDAVRDVIRRSMAANYKGIVFDWLKEQQPRTAQGKPGYQAQGHNDELSPLERAAVDRLMEGEL